MSTTSLIIATMEITVKTPPPIKKRQTPCSKTDVNSKVSPMLSIHNVIPVTQSVANTNQDSTSIFMWSRPSFYKPFVTQPQSA